MHEARADLAAIAVHLAFALVLTVGCAKPDANPGGGGCAAGLTQCGAARVDTDSSVQSCGTCGNACAQGQVSNGGTCSCAPGTMRCGNNCVNLSQSHDQCGSCTNVSTAAQVCNNTQCSSTCTSPLMNCGGSCIDTRSSTQHCGG